MKTQQLATNIKLNKTSGKDLISKSKLFYWIDSDFTNYGCNVKEKATKELKVEVREMTSDGTFKDIFEDLGDLDSLCLTQGQILDFVENHKNQLRTDGWATFFLFKVKTEFFVASVDLGGDGALHVHVRRFSYDSVWPAEYRLRVVVPQLTLNPSDPRPFETLALETRIKSLEEDMVKLKKIINI